MQGFASEFSSALALILNGDAELWAIVLLSLKVSIFAVLISAVIGMPVGAALAVARFPGRRILIVLVNALMGLPPVVVGLLVYLMLSRSGPLGVLELLYTPTAMIIAQVVLVTPIIAALTRQVVEILAEEYAEQLRSLGVSRLASVPVLLWDARLALVTALLAGFGRAIAEVGAVIIVGGNIKSCNAGDDDDDCFGNVQGQSGACTCLGGDPDRYRGGSECDGQHTQPAGRTGGAASCVTLSVRTQTACVCRV